MLEDTIRTRVRARERSQGSEKRPGGAGKLTERRGKYVTSRESETHNKAGPSEARTRPSANGAREDKFQNFGAMDSYKKGTTDHESL